jgi:hypothetical protein
MTIEWSKWQLIKDRIPNLMCFSKVQNRNPKPQEHFADQEYKYISSSILKNSVS